MKSDYQINAAASRLRKDADALLVMVITADRVCYHADPRLAPEDARQAIAAEADNVAKYIAQERAQKKAVGK